MGPLEALVNFLALLPGGRGEHSSKAPLPDGVHTPWPISVEAFELPRGFGRPGRKIGRKPWDWRPVTITFTADTVVVTDSDGTVVLSAPTQLVSAAGPTATVPAKIISPELTLALSPSDHQTSLGLNYGEATYQNRLLYHRLVLAQAGQVLGP